MVGSYTDIKKAEVPQLPQSAPGEISNNQTAYSVFTPAQKRMITLMIGLGMLFSPMSANIYFPCVPALQSALDSSRQLINLTITSYIIVQGIIPAYMIGGRQVDFMCIEL